MMNSPDNVERRMLLIMLRCALACVAITVACGALAIICYVGGTPVLNALGLKFRLLRPLHTTFASVWIFMAGLTCVQMFLFHEFGPATRGDRKRFRFQMICWGLAGVGILCTLPFGLTSGREYLGFHPLLSLLVVAGWLTFAWTFFSKVRSGFWDRPVYVYMWGLGLIFFLYTFAEGHAYLIPSVRDHPVADLQIQWKSCGTIVASFNMLVYGTLIYLGERLSGSTTYARSPKAFMFFGVGVLNSFTNYAHHTYHLPQDPYLKWVAFVVSMLEIIILFSVFNDVRSMLSKRKPTDPFQTNTQFIQLAKSWTLGLLALAILISIPPLNTMIHGTHVVMGHAMGSEIGIDSFVLFAFVATLLAELHAGHHESLRRLNSQAMAESMVWLNRSLVALVLILAGKGIMTGFERVFAIPAPEWLQIFPGALAVVGCLHGAMLLRILWLWLPMLTLSPQVDHREPTPQSIGSS